MNKKDRLKTGKAWARAFHGSKIIHAYSRKFKVPLLCSINDLISFGIRLNQEDIDTIKYNLHILNKVKMKKKDFEELTNRMHEKQEFEFNYSNDYFY